MAVMKYTYTYRKFPNAPKATAIDKMINKCGYVSWILFSVIPSVIFCGLACMIYNGNGHELGFFDGILMLLGFILFVGGALIVRGLNLKYEWTKKIAEKESGKTYTE